MRGFGASEQVNGPNRLTRSPTGSGRRRVHETFKGREATKHLAVSDRMFHERLVAIGGNRDQVTTPTGLTGSRYARDCYMLSVRVAVLLVESPAGSAILNLHLAPGQQFEP